MLGCGEKPVYDDRLNLTAEPVDPGGLAGRFYLRGITNHLADLSFQNLGIGIRSFLGGRKNRDPDNQTYLQTMDFCSTINYELRASLP